MRTPDPEFLRRVAVFKSSEGKYPLWAPYHPSDHYPEYPFEDVSTERNFAYEAVRGALQLSGLDRDRFGTTAWNPLSDIISSGDSVVIKPNMVRDFHEQPERGTEALITHASVLRAVIDYCYLAAGPKGKIVIADSPQNDADWTGLWHAFHFDALLWYYKTVAPDFKLDIRDVRKEAVVSPHGVVTRRYKRPGDPLGYTSINLGESSEFEEVKERCGKFYGSEYDVSETNDHHQPALHEYSIANTFLNADVIINVPKLKTHKKSGISAWLKSVIGICGDKNWLPHHTRGTLSEGGDQFAEDNIKRRTERRLMAGVRGLVSLTGPAGGFIGGIARELGAYVFGDTNADAIRSGNWHGNDTIWRTVLDLHKVWIYADKSGVLRQTPQRKFICLVDGMVAGEGNGPLAPDPNAAGLCVVGFDPIATDTACAVLMGFDPGKLPILSRAGSAKGFALETVTPEETEVVSNVRSWNGRAIELEESLHFKPHFGWKGFIER